jgi:hypothetical protein
MSTTIGFSCTILTFSPAPVCSSVVGHLISGVHHFLHPFSRGSLLESGHASNSAIIQVPVVLLLTRGVPDPPEHHDTRFPGSGCWEQDLQLKDLTDCFLTSQECALFLCLHFLHCW